MTDPTVISTFSGPGGSSLGYERAGCDVRVALDCAPDKFSNAIPETYRRNHPETTFLEQDARETTAGELLNAAGLDKRELDKSLLPRTCRILHRDGRKATINNSVLISGTQAIISPCRILTLHI